MKFVTTLRALATIALVTALRAAGRAQSPAVSPQQVTVDEPTTLAADSPRAKLAAALVERLMAGDRARAEQFLRENGAASYVGSAAMTTELDRFVSAAPVKYEITGFLNGQGSDVIVELQRGGTSDALAVVLTPGEPHKVGGIRALRREVSS